MPSESTRHHRRSIRLQGYDYRQAGAYFVTACTQNRTPLFGEIVDGEMRLNELGQIIADSWNWLSDQYPYVSLDAWIIMPNHLHGIIVITDEDNDASTNDGGLGSRTAPTTPITKRKPLGRLIGAFKTVSTKSINVLRCTHTAVVWQRNFYEHIIRNRRALDAIRHYIENNPQMWPYDIDNLIAERPSSEQRRAHAQKLGIAEVELRLYADLEADYCTRGGN